MAEFGKDRKISINHQNFKINNGENILDGLARVECFIPKQCKNGRCKSCVARCIQGNTSISQIELALTDKEVDDGYILCCCRTATSDIVLKEIEPLNIMLPESQIIIGKILKIDFLNPANIKLSIKYRPGTHLNSIPGQYFDLSLMGTSRSYSILDHDKSNAILTFLIKFRKDGKFSSQIPNLKLENTIRLNGPKGSFIRRANTIASPEVYFATGTGISPVKNILSSKIKENDLSNTYLYWGNRHKKDFIDIPEFKNSGISIFKCISREPSCKEYHNGYVYDVFKNTFAISLKNPIIYCSGNIEMINTIRREIPKLYGRQKIKFYSDAFLSGNEI
jgi:CDP-4-dehydro-6-deoxyglucose reductase, E3